MSRLIIILMLSLGWLIGFSQDRFTVTDPDIKFSVEVPEGWQKYDDGYFYYLIIPTFHGDENLSITYYETSDTTINENFDYSMKSIFPLNESDYHLLKTGNDEVDGKPAKWAIFTSKFKGNQYKSIIYMFIRHGQAFKIRGTARLSNFDDHIEKFRHVIRSLKAERLEKSN